MKKVSLFFAVMMISFAASSQNTFTKGDKVLNLGVGFGTYGDFGTTTIPPVSLSLEYCVKDNLFNDKSSLGIGGYAGYHSSKWEYLDDAVWGYKYSNFILGARGVLHYQLINKLDTYWGLLLGYDIASAKFYGEDFGPYTPAASKVGGLVYSTFLGARYYFNEKFAANAELGYGIATFHIGISYKL